VITILAVSFSRSEKPLRQINSRDCCITSNIVVVLSCGGYSLSGVSPFLLIVRLAGHRVDGAIIQKDERGREGIFMPVFLLRFSLRESRMETICHPVGKAT